MPEFFFTMAANQIQSHWPDREDVSGYVRVVAKDATEAVEKMVEAYGLKWAFRYQSLDDVHPNDRYLLASIEGFVPTVRYIALASNVLAVATTRIEGTWSAYVGAVPGRSHDSEYKNVLREGTKLAPRIAFAMFRNLHAQFKNRGYAA